MARFSARPTMPPRPISASFLDSLAVRYLSAAALASASGSGLSCGKMMSGPGRSSAPSRLVRAPRLATVAMQRINLSLMSPARTAVHSYFGRRHAVARRRTVWYRRGMEVVRPERFFHERFGLSDRALERILGTALERRADFADLYFEFRVNQTASLEEGVVKKATRNVSQGVGVRVVAGARSGYAHSNEVSLERLELAARTARAIADEHSATAALPAERRGRRGQGSYGGGARFVFDTLLDGRAERFAREAARQALTNLEAAAAPAGTMTVVLGPGWPGVLLHEAIGHGLEGDFNRKR